MAVYDWPSSVFRRTRSINIRGLFSIICDEAALFRHWGVWCACGNCSPPSGCAENSPNMSSDCLTVVSVPEDRYDDAIHHLKWNFFADEPLNNAVGLCAKGESQYELERHCLLTLKQGYSRMLVDKKGAVCTRALNRARRNTYMQIRDLCISLSYFTFDIIHLYSSGFIFISLLITR